MAERQFVIFRLNNEEYGIDIQNVREIVLMPEITKYPQAEDFIEGIINLRGKIIPIIDLGKRFYGSATETGDASRIIVVSCRDQILGIIVDEVKEVIYLKESMIEPPPALIRQTNSGVTGVGNMDNRLIIILDLGQTLTTSEVSQLQSAVG